MCGQHNVRASAEDNIGQKTDKGHTHNPGTEIKIPDPTGNRTRAAGLEGRDSTDHATATDFDNSIFEICQNDHPWGLTLLEYRLYRIIFFLINFFNHMFFSHSKQDYIEKIERNSWFRQQRV